MSFIKLKEVSKYYYNKGIIAKGFSKINIEFNIGEFVAITGSSGSGKSTLLNVISGLDTYEDGELYINDEETSHYSEKDYENYRRIYISNIFQDFNLISSYTVYQNIELVLLLNGEKSKNIRGHVLDLIKKVGLYKFRNTKISKLSGGQKQRVAIARALAKDTPVIIADEPTGNLDVKSSKEIIKLLRSISKDKLVIIVTHNIEQIEDFITRRINMHDGKITEDRIIAKITNEEKIDNKKYKSITFPNKIRLSLRNTFNILPKFLLLMFIYLFMTISIISEYASFKEQSAIIESSGYNYIFTNNSDKRIVINKKDKTNIIEEDYKIIEDIENVDYIVKNDLMLDNYVDISDNENFWLYGNLNNLNNFDLTLDLGRFPKSDNEIIVKGDKYDYYLTEDILGKELYFYNSYTNDLDKENLIKIVGIKYNESEYDYDTKFYMSDTILEKFNYQINQSYSKTKVIFLNNYNNYFDIKVNNKVPEGQAYISYENNYQCQYQNCKNEFIKINIENIYYTSEIELKVSETFSKYNMNRLLDIKDYENNINSLYINQIDYDKLYNTNNYQSSVFVTDVKFLKDVSEKLHNLGYNTLIIKDTLVTEGAEELFKVIGTIVTSVLIVVLFFISYFVITIILKSRNKYFTCLRMLGTTKKVNKDLLVNELLIDSNIAFLLFIILLCLNKFEIINIRLLNTILTYLTLKDYILLYLILICMSYLISQKFAKKLFKKSTISTMNMEV